MRIKVRFCKDFQRLYIAVQVVEIGGENIHIIQALLVGTGTLHRKHLIQLLSFSLAILSAGAIAASIYFLTKDQMRFLNLLMPLVTLGALWAIWRNQREVSAATQLSLEQTADARARMTALCDALEAHFLIELSGSSIGQDPLSKPADVSRRNARRRLN